ncbi:hypothetical protein COCVIDRAFT_40294 [Bipolaris victoriae FI3]|uniref:Uncharacterized protein n=1 Tax=Bipolaris victoriae (strain FI3) TaxID=930091 RepID=W7EIV3_BIPV3|nr:hypothetical protein COCVIDRAFT_40294 [Bipolaris victoriae FI3]
MRRLPNNAGFVGIRVRLSALAGANGGGEHEARSTTYVASKNLAEICKQLGEPVATSLEYLPLNKVITKTQKHENDAISFMLLFGDVRKQPNGEAQEVWVLLYPPTKEGEPATLEFSSYDSATGDSEQHSNHNISSRAENAAAFKMPKRPSRGKHGALVRYYFLKKLAAIEAESNGMSELKFPLPVNKGILEGLKAACGEFEDEARAKLARSVRQLSVTLPESQESDATLDFEDAKEPVKEQIRRAWAPQTSHNDIEQSLASLKDKEINIKTHIAKLDDHLMALTEERLDLEQRCKNVEAERLAAEKEAVIIKAQRDNLFKGLSPEAVFELGRNSERKNSTKRRKLD